MAGFRNPQHTAAPEDRIFAGACSVFVQNLDREVDDQALHACFSAFGGVAACKVAGGAGDSRGYGFVHYETQEAAQLAIEQIDGLQIGAMTVEVRPFKGAMVRRQVGGIPAFAHHQTVQAAQQAVARAAGPAKDPPMQSMKAASEKKQWDDKQGHLEKQWDDKQGHSEKKQWDDKQGHPRSSGTISRATLRLLLRQGPPPSATASPRRRRCAASARGRRLPPRQLAAAGSHRSTAALRRIRPAWWPPALPSQPGAPTQPWAACSAICLAASWAP